MGAGRGSWQGLGEGASDVAKRAWRALITPIMSLRYRRWRLARSVARMMRWLRTDWRPLVIGVVALVAALIAGSRIRVDGHAAVAAVAASPGHPAVAAQPASGGRPLATAPQVLVVFALLGFLRLAWEARKRTVFQDIVDGTGTYKDGVVPGLSAMMAAEVSRLAGLFRSLDAQRNFGKDDHSLQDPLRATLQVDDAAQYLESAVSQSSTISLGPITVPVGAILSLLARLMKGPRVGGNLQWDGEQLLLVVRYDGKPPRVWQVTADLSGADLVAARVAAGASGIADFTTAATMVGAAIDPTVGNGPAGAGPITPSAFPLGRMVEELGCRMFTDLSLKGTVRYQAAAAFTRAMEIYVEEGRRGRGDPARLHEVARALLDAVAADQNFELASYNLGVVYGEMGRSEAARQILAEARQRNPDRWDVTYALALPRRDQQPFAHGPDRAGDQPRLAVPEAERLPRQLLCDEVIRLRPGPGAEAQAYDLRGFLEAPTDSQRAQGKALLHQGHELLAQARVVFDSLLPHAATLDGAVDDARRRFARAAKTSNLALATTALSELARALDPATTPPPPGDAVKLEVLRRRAVALSADCERTRGLLAENRAARVQALAAAGESQRRAVRRAWKALRQAERAAGPSEYSEDSDDSPALRRHRVLASTCLVHLAVTFLDSTELDEQVGARDRGRRRRAEVLLHQAVRLDPPDPEAHYRLGRVFARGGRSARRFGDLELRKAVALRPTDSSYWARLLQSRVQANDAPAVIAALAAYLQVSPPPLDGREVRTSHRRVVVNQLLSNSAVWKAVGTPWLGDDQPSGLTEDQQKERRYELAGRLRAMPVLADWLQAEAGRARRGDAAAWVRLWEQLAVTKPREDLGWEHLASAWALKKAYDGYLETRDLSPGTEVDIIAGEVRDAIEHLLRTNPEVCRREGLRGEFAQWLHGCGRPEDAIVEAERARQAEPFNPFGLTVVADAYLAMQEYVLADQAYQRAAQWVNDRKEVGHITWARATCLFNQADDQRNSARRDATLTSAIQQLDRALDLLDDGEIDERVLTHYWLGRLHVERRDFDRAIPHLRTASSYRSRGVDRFAHASSRITALLVLADARAANRLYEEAVDTYEEVERSVAELVPLDLARIVGVELQDKRALGHVVALALAGRAEHLVRRRADLAGAATLLHRAREQSAAGGEGEGARLVQARLEAVAGLIASAGGDVSTAERHLQQAIDHADNARVYLDLVEVWARQIDQTDKRRRRDLAHRIDDLLRHVDEIDLRDEWAANVVPFRSLVDRVLNEP